MSFLSAEMELVIMSLKAEDLDSRVLDAASTSSEGDTVSCVSATDSGRDGRTGRSDASEARLQLGWVVCLCYHGLRFGSAMVDKVSDEMP